MGLVVGVVALGAGVEEEVPGEEEVAAASGAAWCPSRWGIHLRGTGSSAAVPVLSS